MTEASLTSVIRCTSTWENHVSSEVFAERRTKSKQHAVSSRYFNSSRQNRDTSSLAHWPTLHLSAPQRLKPWTARSTLASPNLLAHIINGCEFSLDSLRILATQLHFKWKQTSFILRLYKVISTSLEFISFQHSKIQASRSSSSRSWANFSAWRQASSGFSGGGSLVHTSGIPRTEEPLGTLSKSEPENTSWKTLQKPDKRDALCKTLNAKSRPLSIWDSNMKYPPMSGVLAILKDKCGIASSGKRHVSGSPVAGAQAKDWELTRPKIFKQKWTMLWKGYEAISFECWPSLGFQCSCKGSSQISIKVRHGPW